MIRVRFAPSPTGFLHIGGARTALFNFLFARNNGGKFILRIEDTDRERSTEASVKNLIKSLKWLGLNWDEGPEIGGEYGPYFQTQRFHIYKKYIDQLIDGGYAYPCFCTEEELKEEREKQIKMGLPPKYSGKCRNLPKEVVMKKLRDGKPFSVRFKVPHNEKITFTDLIHGNMEFDSNIFGDFVILRSNGYPTYNFSVVIDDALMKISHVIRGDDHLSNTPKQVMLYKDLGFEMPQFAHVSMILGPDGTRLSKRHGATSVEEFQKEGYLHEAIVNFLALLGWSPPEIDGKVREILSMDELIKYFSLDRVSKNPAIMNMEKLKWLNGIYLRSKSEEEILSLVPDLIKDPFFKGNRKKVLKYIRATKDYYYTLSDVKEHIKDFSEYNFNKEIVGELNKNYVELLEKLINILNTSSSLTLKDIGNIFKDLSREFNIKGKELYVPLRKILSGREEGPELQHFFTILSKNEIIRRLQMAIGTIKDQH